MAYIDSVNIPPQFSADNGVTWLTLVCTRDWSLTGDTPSTTEETYCGKVTGYGSPGYEGAASAIGEFAPGGTQVSMEMAQSWWFNKTALKFRAAYPNPAGTDFYAAGDTVLRSFNPTFGESGTSASFDIAWTISNLDITP